MVKLKGKNVYTGKKPPKNLLKSIASFWVIDVDHWSVQEGVIAIDCFKGFKVYVYLAFEKKNSTFFRKNWWKGFFSAKLEHSQILYLWNEFLAFIITYSMISCCWWRLSLSELILCTFNFDIFQTAGQAAALSVDMATAGLLQTSQRLFSHSSCCGWKSSSQLINVWQIGTLL